MTKFNNVKENSYKGIIIKYNVGKMWKQMEKKFSVLRAKELLTWKQKMENVKGRLPLYSCSLKLSY